MRVRGNVISSIKQFVEDKFPDQYDRWYASLSDESKNIYLRISTAQWYPVVEGVIEPTQSMCAMFFPSEKKGAWESGRYNAEVALTGIYKIFVLVSKPSFIIKRAGRILPTFYEDTEINLVESSTNSLTIHISKLPIKNRIIEYRIAGWVEKAMEICGCKNLKIQLPKSLAAGDPVMEIKMQWD